jgi:cell division protein FtsB
MADSDSHLFQFRHGQRTRAKIADHNDQEFVYGGQSTEALSSFNRIILRLLWAAVAALLVRMVFMDRGLLDLYNKHQNLEFKRFQIESLAIENNRIKQEIIKLKSDRGYQKKITREHLGVIAADEYLIQFARELD